MAALPMTSTVRKQREMNAGWDSYCSLSAQQDVGPTGRWASRFVIGGLSLITFAEVGSHNITAGRAMPQAEDSGLSKWSKGTS